VGLAACSGLEFTADLSTATAPGTAQRRSSFCENVIDEQSAGATAMQSVGRCEACVAGDEVWGKVYLSYLLGSANESFAAVELMPENVHFLGSGFAVYGTSDTTLTGITYGAELGAGIDYSVAPDWDIKLGALYRQGFVRAKLEDKSQTYAMSGGSLAAAQGALSLAYTF
jgi:hypothetical protein